MKFCEIKVYIASPFFNQTQLNMVDKIERTLDQYGVKYFSPRLEGVITKMTPEEKEKHIKKIYQSNIQNMQTCNMMIAVIDDYDTGTVFELGYFNSIKDLIETGRRIVTITGNDYDLNVMLKFGVDCHLKEVENLSNLVQGMRSYGLEDHVFEHWDSKPEVKS